MLLTVFFTGLGVIYLAIVVFILVAQFRDDRSKERFGKQAAANKIELNNLDGDQSDATV